VAPRPAGRQLLQLQGLLERPLRQHLDSVLHPARQDWPERLGSDVHADAIIDRIVHHTIWIETGGTNIREHAARNTA
jgi:hypothetical protein